MRRTSPTALTVAMMSRGVVSRRCQAKIDEKKVISRETQGRSDNPKTVPGTIKEPDAAP